jgi:hypothetical protein
MDVLEKYHNNNKDEAKKICDYIQENRQVEEKEKIHFKKIN